MGEGAGSIVLRLRNVRKDYGGLRPLRIESLDLRQGQGLALAGFDRATAEVLVNLVTGATVPDSGEVHVFGVPTTAIADADAWLASLDRFGIVSERAVLLDQLTVAQNLAVPLTLQLDPVPEDVMSRVRRLAGEVGLDAGDLQRLAGDVSAAARQRVRLARAIALNPLVLLAEHPNASLPAPELPAFAARQAAVATNRGLASLTLTADRGFAEAVAENVLVLQPATGELLAPRGWRRWLRP